MTLPRMAALMMSGMCARVQAELDGLSGELTGHGVRTRAVSAQAFSKARRGLSADLFELARARLIELAQARVDSMRCNGLRLAAAGTRLRVATRQGHERCADHDAFALFLPGPGPELTLHAALHPADGAERQMLFEALDVLQPHTDLLLLDRGYIGNMMDEPASRPDRLYAPGALKPVLGACLLRIERCRDRLADVLAVIDQTRCRIQPARSYPRPPRKVRPHLHLAYKVAR